jgi:hypothetical protein
MTPYAMHDVRSMARFLEHSREAGDFNDISQLPTGAPAVDPRSDPR